MKFFVPFTESDEQSERIYNSCAANHGYPVSPNGRRLCAISFPHRIIGKRRDRKITVRAEVGKEIVGFAEQVGPVLVIIESGGLLTVHTVGRGGLSGSPILVGPDEVAERVYFDSPVSS